MPIARFEMPDGRIARFEVPEGTTPEQAQAMIQRQIEQNPEQFSAAPQDKAQAQPEQEDGFLKNVSDVALEGMGAVNRGVTQTADFLTTTPINAALELAGSDRRVPRITDALSAGTAGNFMEEGIGRDIMRTGGEMVGPGVAAGSVLRSGAQALPKFTAASEGTRQGVLRQMGSSTIGQDAAYSAVSGVGSAVGQDVGGDTGAAVGALAAPIALATSGTFAGTLRSIFSGDKSAAARTIDDFAAFGQSPTVGMASGKEGIQSAETISGSTIGGGPLRRKSEQLADAMQKRLAQIADDLSTKEGAEEAGLQIQKGITGKGGFVDRFRSRSSVLWSKADGMIDESIPIKLDNTKAKLDDLVKGGQIGDILDNPQLAKIKAVLDDVESVDYQTMRGLRSSIGQKLSSNELISDIPRSELKQIYGALSEDIKTIAQQSSDDALKAFKRANNYSRSGHERIDDHLTRLANKVNPDEVYRAIAKGGEGVKQINAVKRSVSPEDWEVVASNVVRRLGRATPGQQNIVGEEAMGDAFSVSRFVTDWNKLGPARKALFSGSDKITAYGDDLAKIARAASTIKEASKQSANNSGTAQAASRIAAGTGLSTGLLQGSPTILGLTAGSIAMNNAGARLMTNPQFVKWLAQSAKIPASRSSAAIGGLVAAGKKSEADDAAAIFELVKELEEKNEP